MGGDRLRLRSFALALAVALGGTQALILAGHLPTVDMALLPPLLPWAGALFGGMFFGLGMALVGSCPFGTLVRLGGGDRRALVVLLVFGLAVWAGASGVAAAVRFRLLDPLALPLGGGGRTDMARRRGCGPERMALHPCSTARRAASSGTPLRGVGACNC